MPLRDHFRPPILKLASWEGFHGMWPAVIVMKLRPQLPKGYTAEPRVHLGAYFEIDVTAYEQTREDAGFAFDQGSGGSAVATSSMPKPTFAFDSDLGEQYSYEVLIFDRDRNRQLVAAVEIVSPANKNRPENRRAFVAKCAALLQQGVCISIVDLVTIRHFNLYSDLLELMNREDPSMPAEVYTYAATCRTHRVGESSRVETWAYPASIGQTLPTVPLWLNEDQAVSLDLEATYEETCRVMDVDLPS